MSEIKGKANFIGDDQLDIDLGFLGRTFRFKVENGHAIGLKTGSLDYV